MYVADFSQPPQQVQNIFGLPSRISIHTNFRRHRTKTAVNTDVEKIKTSLRRRIFCALLHIEADVRSGMGPVPFQ